jgi:hypothetical protein
MKATQVLILLAVLAAVYATDNEHPKYELLKQQNGYEIRAYAVDQAQVWSEASVESGYLMIAQNKCFRKLFDYIQGNNAASQSIAMTSPVSLSISEDGTTYTERFFVPAAIGQNAPTPSDPEVKLVTLTKHVVASIEFGGWATWSTWQYYQEQLIEQLHADGITLDDSMPIRLCQYNPPFEVFNRKNEIWVPIKY